MKHIPIIFATFLLVAVCYSCNGNKVGEAPIAMEEDVVMEDFFVVYNLIPNDNVKETLRESLLPFVTNLSDDYGDSICIEIYCPAFWNPLENDNMFSIKITEIETELLHLVINDDRDAGRYLDWDRLSDRPLLRTVKAILDAGTYSLHCVDLEEWTKSFFDACREDDSMIRTEIRFKIYFQRWCKDYGMWLGLGR